MKTVVVTEQGFCRARAWYVKYPLDAYALGPIRFDEAVTAETAVEEARLTRGARPQELWPDGPVEATDEAYTYELDVPEEDVE